VRHRRACGRLPLVSTAGLTQARGEVNLRIYFIMGFTYQPPDDLRFHQMLVTYLETQNRHDMASLLANVKLEVKSDGIFSRRRWDGFFATLRLTVPIARLAAYSDDSKRELLSAAQLLMPPDVGYDLLEVEVAPAFDDADLHMPIEARAPTVQVRWDSMDDDQFERLVFDMVNTSRGYRNAQWLTHTNAPDDGRDLSVERAHDDILAGTLVSRVIVACRHWRARSTGPSEISTLREQMRLWTPPRVDVLVIATSGRFTTPAIRLIEQQNQSDSALRIEPWASSHLEALLARRVDLMQRLQQRVDIPF
jgi:Restriction endonuclease